MDAVAQALTSGFAAEAQSYLKYVLFSEKADVDTALASTPQVAGLLGEAAQAFRRFAEQERRHALIYLEALAGVRETPENIVAAIEGEVSDIAAYAGAAAAATMEKQDELAKVFKRIAAVEARHAEELRALSTRLAAIQLADRVAPS